jgi:hypothetical protein
VKLVGPGRNSPFRSREKTNCSKDYGHQYKP